ncbi:phosphodiesterase [Compostimonas suwonensis]|uniref:3',5'-cyclic AMP phosphodiesterase CpdA n=1 Tax=Compostimonas suwonensis TaxID=1048394 RepID=A0A2M9BU64_9MICO|nr:phosphodiesterase [Compostimonas suwonensis]PJJ61470.1 3',5'-cyclic AMP phosphodiesterase CpdA [Compostimonas suwonensis]
MSTPQRTGAPEAPAPRTAEYPRPDHFLLHLSDTHLIPGDELLYGAVDAEAHLRGLVEEIEASNARPEAIVVTGDLADKGDPRAYVKLRGILEPAAERMGSQLIWVMGNHDNRAAFRAELLDQLPSMRSVDRVHDVNGLRVIALDSSVPGEHYGEITGAQLDWLAEELSSPAPHGTILAMHHPPVPSVLDLAVTVELRDQAALAEVLEGSDVRSIIAGHLHYSTNTTFAGIPVSVASATCYTQDLTVPTGGSRPRDGAQGYNLVHVYESTVLHSVVPMGQFPVMSYTSAQEAQRILDRERITILPPASAPVAAEEPLTVDAPLTVEASAALV